MWKEWTEEEKKEVEMEGTGEDEVGVEAANEAKESEGSISCARGTERMDAERRGKQTGVYVGLVEKTQMHVIAVVVQISSEEGCYALSAAAGETR